MKVPRVSLPVKILFAIIIGIGLGLVLPEWGGRLFVTFNVLFGSYLNFVIPLIIVGLVAAAIGRMGSQAGRPLITTVGLAYGFTILSGLLAYFTGAWIYPSLLEPGSLSADLPQEVTGLTAFFSIEMPPLMPIMTALIFAFIVGLGMASLKSKALMMVAEDFEQIITKTITVSIIPLLPPFICSIFVKLAYEGTVGAMLGVFIKIIAVIFALHLFLLIFQYCVASLFTGQNPFKKLWGMMPAYVTALGTSSSAATIPVTLRSAIKNGVKSEVAGFVIPLCATIHLSGSTLKITSCALALMLVQGIPFDFGLMLGFILMLGVTMVAAPGVPGGAIAAALGILASILGFNEEQQGLMVALYIVMDSFGTAANVTGDGAVALIINRFWGNGGISAPKPEEEPETATAA